MNCALYILFYPYNLKIPKNMNDLIKRRKLNIKYEYFDVNDPNTIKRQKLNDLLRDIESKKIEYLLIPNIYNLIDKYCMIPEVLEKLWQANITIINGNGNIIDPELWRLIFKIYKKSNKEEV